MESTIHFFSEDTDFKLGDQENTSKWVKNCIQKEGLKTGELSFIFTSDLYILKINKEYLDHNYFTDIITFDYREEDVINGDIFISIDRVRENAETLSLTFQEELHRVIIHGVLHIIGFKDKTPEEELLMRSKEDFYLSLRTI